MSIVVAPGPAPINLGALKTYAQAKAETLAQIEGRWNGSIRSYKTPWEKFNDAHIDGIELNQVITIAGMSSSGKSLIANQLEREVQDLNPWDPDLMILSFNFEMTASQILKRGVIGRTGLTNDQISQKGGIILPDSDRQRIRALLNPQSRNLNIFFMEYPKTVQKYKDLCRAFYETHRKNFIVMTDHSVLFQSAANEKDKTATLYSLGAASLELKKEMPFTQIHISQLNREPGKIENKGRLSPLNYPTKDWLFGGDALYQCADTVLINHRPFLLNFPANSYGPEKYPTGPSDVYWHFVKIRDGAPDITHMRGDFEHMRIYDN